MGETTIVVSLDFSAVLGVSGALLYMVAYRRLAMPLLVLVPRVKALVIGVAYAVIVSGADAEISGWLAAASTLLMFSMRSMLALRLAALGATISFIIYAALIDLMPVLSLHLLLVPCNAVRSGELITERRRSAPRF